MTRRLPFQTAPTVPPPPSGHRHVVIVDSTGQTPCPFVGDNQTVCTCVGHIQEALDLLIHDNASALVLIGPSLDLAISQTAVARTYRPDIAIVAVAGTASDVAEERALAAGVHEWVPFDGRDALAIRRAVNRAFARINRTATDPLWLLAMNAHDMVTCHALDGQFLYLSPSAIRFHGLPAESLVGTSSIERIHPEDRDRVAAAVASLITEEDVAIESFRLKRHDGAYIWVESTGRRTRQAHGEECVVVVTRDIHERRLAIEALQASEANLSNILDSDIDSLWACDTAYRLIAWNRRFSDSFIVHHGREPAYGDNILALIHRWDKESPWHEWFDRALAGETIVAEHDFRYAGSRRRYEVRCIPIRQDDHVIGFRCQSHDIEDQYQAEAALRQSERSIRSVIESSPHAIWRVNRELKLEAFNQVYARNFIGVYGCRPQIGGPAFATTDGGAPPRALELVNRAFAGETLTTEYHAVMDGQPAVFESTFNPIYDDHGVVGAWVMSRNITAQHQVEALLRREKELAEATTRAQSEFLAVMSHEIRTPLHAVFGMIELLLETDLSPEQRDFAETLNGSAGTLSSILNDILDYSKLEVGKLAIHAESFDLGRLVRDLVDLLAIRVEEKGLEFVCFLDPSLPTARVGDSVRIRQILINLLGNAIKFTDRGAVMLEVRPSEADPEAVTFRVRDTGIGIPTATQGKLFQKFAQADSSTTRRFGGTGLGLAISQELVRLLGGEIELHSIDGQGSTFQFTVSLPTADAASDDVPNLPDQHLLVLTPIPWRQMVLSEYAARWGATCTAVSCLDAAKSHLASSEVPPTLVIVDWPVHDACDGTVLQQLHLAGLSPRIPALLLQPVRLRRDDRVSTMAGYQGHYSRPILPQTFHEAVLQTRRPTTPTLAAPICPALPSPQTHRILVVDDNTTNLKMALHMLEKLGCTVDTACSGQEAIDSAALTAYDLVFMDCQMPEIDGYQATEAIRQQPGGRHLPIVALTAHALPGDRERCLEAGMNDYLSKPIEREGLQRILSRWLPADPNLLPALERDRLIAAVDHDEDMLTELITTYQAEKPRQVTILNDAAARADLTAVARAAHSIKGALLTLAATAGVAAAKRVEQAAHCADHEALNRALHCLHEQLNRLDSALEW